MLGGDLLRGRGVRAGRCHEDGLAVVAQLLDALLDVGESAVVAALGGRGEVGPRVPATGELLDRGDVDVAVVQVALEGGHVAGQEGPVGADRVAGQRGTAPVGAVLADVGQHLLLGLGHRHAAVELLEQARGLVHRADEVDHLLQGLGRGLDDHVDAVADHVQLEVGDQRGDLDQRVRPEVEAGHLTVDPHQSVAHLIHPTGPGPWSVGPRVSRLTLPLHAPLSAYSDSRPRVTTCSATSGPWPGRGSVPSPVW